MLGAGVGGEDVGASVVYKRERGGMKERETGEKKKSEARLTDMLDGVVLVLVRRGRNTSLT